MQADLRIALAGNPNCGKTTLFNALTGARQRTGNWPGVTVEKKSGRYRHAGQCVEVVDLPGVYALDAVSGGLDERIARDFLAGGSADVILNIVDASNLERNLYLTTQLAALNTPMVVALNMVDVAEDMGQMPDASVLAARLGCPVAPVVAARERGIDALKSAIHAALERGAAPTLAPTGEAEASRADRADVDLATARYALASDLARAAVGAPVGAGGGGGGGHGLTEAIDRIVLNRLLGIPIFLLAMYLLFLFSINIGGAFIDFFDQAAGALFVDGFGHWLAGLGAPAGLTLLLAQGIGGGVQTVATFIPVIGCLYLFLSVLEDSGYMARAAFVMDRLMRAIGLPGKSFVPLIVGFGCNVPAIMATRTLQHRRDRLMTIAMAPFMSCGARLPVYVLFAAAFFPAQAQNAVFALYLIGIAVALLTGLALRHTLMKGEATAFVMEMPPYHLPTLKGVLIHSWDRLKNFILKAGRIIVPMVLVINVLNAVGTDGSFGNEDSDRSVLAEVGRSVAPAFAPLGLTEENWPAAVGIFTGILAKEAVVGTLDAAYAALAEDAAAAGAAQEEAFRLGSALSAAVATIPANLGDALGAWADPLGLAVGDLTDPAAVAEAQAVSTGTFGAMAERFDGTAGAFAYLLFILLYTPCTAALAAVYQESGLRWMFFVAGWTFGLAYGVATLYYQVASFGAQPLSAAVWIGLVGTLFATALIVLKRMGERGAGALLPLGAAPADACGACGKAGRCAK